jgi:hypothetical protein
MEEDDEGNAIANTMKYFYKNRNRYCRSIDPDTVTLLRKVADVESIHVLDIQSYFQQQQEFWENIGVEWGKPDKINQMLQSYVISDLVCRNNKLILIDPDTEKGLGNFGERKCRDNVINIFHLNLELEEEERNQVDSTFAININKGMVYRRDFKLNMGLVIALIKTSINKTGFYNTVYAQPVEEEVVAVEPVVAVEEVVEEDEEGYPDEQADKKMILISDTIKELEKMHPTWSEDKIHDTACDFVNIHSNEYEVDDEEEEEDLGVEESKVGEENADEEEGEEPEPESESESESESEDEIEEKAAEDKVEESDEEKELRNTNPATFNRNNTQASTGIPRNVVTQKLAYMKTNYTPEQKIQEKNSIQKLHDELLKNMLGNNPTIITLLSYYNDLQFDNFVEVIIKIYEHQYEESKIVHGGTIISEIYDRHNN